jgi:hypothetical protein
LEINGFILASIFSPFSFSFLFYFFERKQVYNYKLTCKLGNEGKQGRMGVIAMGSVPMTHEYWRKSKEIIAIFFIINLWPTVRNIYIYIYIYIYTRMQQTGQWAWLIFFKIGTSYANRYYFQLLHLGDMYTGR